MMRDQGIPAGGELAGSAGSSMAGAGGARGLGGTAGSPASGNGGSGGQRTPGERGLGAQGFRWPVATGGVIGSGGTAASGGVGGIAATGGRSGTGGTAGTAGSPASGGAGGSGGSAPGGSSGTGGAAVVCVPVCASTSYCSSGTCKLRSTEFTIGSGTAPGYIATGPDGNLWFTTGSDGSGTVGGAIGRMTTTGTPTLFPIFTAAQNTLNLTVSSVGIAAGPDGKLWFDAVSSDGKAYISSMSTTGVSSNNIFSTNFPRLGRVAIGPDSNVWVAIMAASPSSGSNTLEVSTTSGSISERTLPMFSGPYGIVAGADGNIWFADTQYHQVGRFKVSDGTVSEFAISGIPQNLTVGADGNIWFTEPSGSIGRCAVSGTIIEFAAPNGPWDVATGPGWKRVVYRTKGANMIARVTPSGQITEYSTPASPYGVTAGPDGNIWFTEPSAGKVARFIVP